jgi:hypothetical protein
LIIAFGGIAIVVVESSKRPSDKMRWEGEKRSASDGSDEFRANE